MHVNLINYSTNFCMKVKGEETNSKKEREEWLNAQTNQVHEEAGLPKYEKPKQERRFVNMNSPKKTQMYKDVYDKATNLRYINDEDIKPFYKVIFEKFLPMLDDSPDEVSIIRTPSGRIKVSAVGYEFTPTSVALFDSQGKNLRWFIEKYEFPADEDANPYDTLRLYDPKGKLESIITIEHVLGYDKKGNFVTIAKKISRSDLKNKQ